MSLRADLLMGGIAAGGFGLVSGYLLGRGILAW